MNAGCIRVDVPAGEISYKTCKNVHPFGNMICLIEAKGQDIIEAMEWVSAISGQTGEDGKMMENSSLMQAAGLSYVIDASVESTASGDSNGVWISGPTGEYKVKELKVYNRETKQYEPLDPEKTYTVAGTNYFMRNGGLGLVMFANCRSVCDFVGEDYMILAEYLKAFTKNEEGVPVVNSKNSPLTQYENYLLDYEDPSGSGRLAITGK